MKRSIPLLLALVGVLSLALGAACSTAKHGEEPEQWTCPMHPTYIADRAGTCPICNMDLVRKAKPAAVMRNAGCPKDQSKRRRYPALRVRTSQLSGSSSRLSPGSM